MIYLLQPLSGNGYQFWSGIGSDFSELTLITATIVWYIHSRCHVDNRAIGGKNCWKRGHYPFKHFKLCKKHHPEVPDKLTHLYIKKLHKSAKVK